MPATEPNDSDTATKAGTKGKRLPPIVMDPTGVAVIMRAIQLKLAGLGSTDEETPSLRGHALAAIVSAWMQAEAEQIRAARP